MRNTVNDWLTTATVLDPERRSWWIEWFGSPIAPIISIVAIRVDVPGRDHAEAYMLDLDAITEERKEKLLQGLAKTFGVPLDEARIELERGVPILAEGVSVSTRDQGIFFSLMDDEWEGVHTADDEEEDRFLDYEED